MGLDLKGMITVRAVDFEAIGIKELREHYNIQPNHQFFKEYTVYREKKDSYVQGLMYLTTTKKGTERKNNKKEETLKYQKEGRKLKLEVKQHV